METAENDNLAVTPKREKRFKFLTFTQRIENINVDIFRKRYKDLTDPTAYSSFFEQTLEKLKMRIMDEDFDSFLHDLKGKYESLELILLHKKDLIKICTKYLQSPQSNAIIPVMECLTALIHDLGSEIYASFPTVLKTLSALIQYEAVFANPPLLEPLFQCIAFMFKYLQESLIKDITILFNNYIPFLAHKRNYMKKFAAESFCFLLRQLTEPMLKTFYTQILSPDQKAFEDKYQEINYCEAIAILLFYFNKGLKFRFHSKIAANMTALFNTLNSHPKQSREFVQRIVNDLFEMMARYTKKLHSTPVWNFLTTSLISAKQLDFEHQTLLTCFALWTQAKDGEFVLDYPKSWSVLDHLLSLKKSSDLTRPTTSLDVEIAYVLAALFSHPTCTDKKAGSRVWAQLVNRVDKGTIFQIATGLSEEDGFLQYLVPPILDSLQPAKLTAASPIKSSLLPFLRAAQSAGLEIGVEFHSFFISVLESEAKERRLDSLSPDLLLVLQISEQLHWNQPPLKTLGQLESKLLKGLLSGEISTQQNLANTNSSSNNNNANNIESSTIDAFGQDNSLISQADIALSAVVQIFRAGIAWAETQTSHVLRKLLDLVQRFPLSRTHCGVLACLADALNNCVPSETMGAHFQPAKIATYFLENLVSRSSAQRLAGLQVLAALFPPWPAPIEDDLLCGFLEAERLDKMDINLDKKFQPLLQLLEAKIRTGSISGLNAAISVRALLGMLTIPFSRLWPLLVKVLAKLASAHFAVFWDPFLHAVLSAHQQIACTHPPALAATPSETGPKKKEASTTSNKTKTGSDLDRDEESSVSHSDNSEDDDSADSDSDEPSAAPVTDKSAEAQRYFTTLYQVLAQTTVPGSADLSRLAALLASDTTTFTALLHTPHTSPKTTLQLPPPPSSPKSKTKSQKQGKKVIIAKKPTASTTKTYNALASLVSTQLHTLVAVAHTVPALYQLLQPHALTHLSWPVRSVRAAALRALQPQVKFGSSGFVQALDLLVMEGKGIQHAVSELTGKLPMLRGNNNNNNLSSNSKSSAKGSAILKGGEFELWSDWTVRILMGTLHELSAGAAGAEPQSHSTAQRHTASGPGLSGKKGAQQKAIIDFLLLIGIDSFFALFKQQYAEVLRTFKSNNSKKNGSPFAFLAQQPQMLQRELQGKNLVFNLELIQDLLDRLNTKAVTPHFVDLMVMVLAILAYRSSVGSAPLARLLKQKCFLVFTCMAERHAELLPIPALQFFLEQIQEDIDNFSVSHNPKNFLECFLRIAENTSLVLHIKPFLHRSVTKVAEIWGAPQAVATKNNLKDNFLELLNLTLHHQIHNHIALLSPQHIDTLVSQFSQHVKNSLSKKNNPIAELEMLSKVSPLITNKTQASNLSEGLYPYISKRLTWITLKAKKTLLHLFNSLIPMRVNELTKVIEQAALLFAFTADPEYRLELCAGFEMIGKHSPKIKEIVHLLKDLNSSSGLDYQPNFSLRGETYSLVTDTWLPKMNALQLQPFLFNFFFFLRNEDASVRRNASYALQKAIEYCSKSTSPDIQALIPSKLYLLVRSGLSDENPVARKEFLEVFRAIVFHYQEQYPDQAQLTNADPEKDFYFNMSHIQLVRQIRAILNVGKILDSLIVAVHQNTIESQPKDLLVLSDQESDDDVHQSENSDDDKNFDNSQGHESDQESDDDQQSDDEAIDEEASPVAKSVQFEQATLASVLIPLWTQVMSEATDPSLNDAIARTIGKCCKLLEWNLYEKTLLKAVSNIEEHHNQEKKWIRLFLCILDSFHFSLQQENKKAIQVCLQGAVIPRLYKCLKDQSGKQPLRIKVALALISVARVLSQDIQEREYPRLITIICQSLVSKDFDVRHATRDTLAKVLDLLGYKYFRYTLGELTAALKDGPQLHVLAFTIHTLLRSFVKKQLEPGVLDPDTMNALLPILFNDLMGEPSVERGIEKLVKITKEMRSEKSYESFQFVARLITFPEQFEPIFQRIYETLETCNKRKEIGKLEEILNQVAIGIAYNKSVQPIDLLNFVHRLLTKLRELAKQVKKSVAESKIPQNLRGPKKAKLEEEERELRLASKSKKEISYFTANQNVLTEFVLYVMEKNLRQNFFDLKDPNILQAVDPIVPILVTKLSAKSMKTIKLSLKILTSLMRSPLPAIAKGFQEIGDTIFKLFEKYLGDTEISTDSLNSLSTLIRDTKFAPSQSQYVKLLDLIHGDYQRLALLPQTFKLLHVILKKKIVLPRMYDLVDEVGRELIRNYMPAIRKSCFKIFVEFLLTYPLTDKKIASRLTFLLNNLNYPHDFGRITVLETFFEILTKFPSEVVTKHVDLLFFPLVTRLNNEESPQVKELLGNVLSLFLEKTPSQLYKLLSHAQTWASQTENESLTRLGIQLIGFVTQAQAKTNQFTLKAWDTVKTLLVGAVSQTQDWMLAYFGLISIEKLIREFSKLITSPDFMENLWKHFSTLLLHEQTWIRRSATRLFTLLFAQLETTAAPGFYAQLQTSSASNWITHQPSWQTLLSQFCTQLESETLGDSHAGDLVRAIHWVALLLDRFAQEHVLAPFAAKSATPKRGSTSKKESSLHKTGPRVDPTTPEMVEQLSQIFNSEQITVTLSKITESEESVEMSKDFPMVWTFQRLLKVAARGGFIARTAVYQIFVSLFSTIPDEILQTPAGQQFYLIPAFSALLRQIERRYDGPRKNKGESPQLVTATSTATAVLKLLEERLAARIYDRCFNKARELAMQKRGQKQIKKKTLMVVDPLAYALKKKVTGQRKKQSKRRKVQSEEWMKMHNTLKAPSSRLGGNVSNSDPNRN